MRPVYVTRLLSAFFSALLVIVFIGCNDQKTGDIPYNEANIRNNILSIKEAVRYTADFRHTRDTFYSRVTDLERMLNLAKAESFNRDAIAVLLNQKDSSGAYAAGIRMYLGRDGQGQVRFILVPIDSKGNDIINRLITDKAVSIPGIPSAYAQSGGGQVIENGQRCPTICGSDDSGLPND